MAKRSKHSFIKFRKEIDRKKKAEEKMLKRQGKKGKPDDVDDVDEILEPETAEEDSQDS